MTTPSPRTPAPIRNPTTRQPHNPSCRGRYGAASNDYIVMMTSKQAETGGESYLLDGYALLRSLSPGDPLLRPRF